MLRSGRMLPVLLHQTSYGHVPHLTPDNQHRTLSHLYADPASACFRISASSFLDGHAPEISLNSYLGTPHPIFLDIGDGLDLEMYQSIAGKSTDRNKIAYSTRAGLQTMHISSYLNYIQIWKPSFWTAPVDYAAFIQLSSVGKKKRRIAPERCIQYLDECIKKKDMVGGSMFAIVPVLNGQGAERNAQKLWIEDIVRRDANLDGYSFLQNHV